MTRTRITDGARWAWRAAAQASRGAGPVVWTGLALIVAQLAFRGWAVSGSWFQLDDFAFISRSMNNPLDAGLLLEGYGGHLMPAGFLLTHLFVLAGPLEFGYHATTLLLMQAVASVGCLVLLRSMFGPRWGILPPLVLYLSSAVSLPAFIWWAAGVNQLPLQAALFWGLLALLSYLRRPRASALAGTVVAMVAGLAFWEKTLLVYVAFAVVAAGYFATGTFSARVTHVWRTYRPAVLVHGALAGLYTVWYATTAMTGFDNDQEAPLLDLVGNQVFRAYLPSLVGGPLRWEPAGGPGHLAAPSQLVVVASVLAVGALVYHLDRTRLRSRRAWLLPAGFLAADVMLVASARAGFVGTSIGLEMRYITELGAVSALALALAALPLRGAVETVEPRAPSPLLDGHGAAALTTLVVAVLGTMSSYSYADRWRSSTESRDYFDTVAADTASWDSPVPVVDVAVPEYLMWAYRHPENTTSHVLRMYEDEFRYVEASVDELYVVDTEGHLRPVGIPPVRRNVPGEPGCAFPLHEGVAMPLDGPVMGGGWWIRLGYYAAADTGVTIEAGDSVHDVELPAGLHNVFVSAEGEFDTLRFSGADPAVQLCGIDAALGIPEPVAAEQQS